MPTYMLSQRVIVGETTSVGVELYNGGDLLDQNNRTIGTYTIVTQTFATVTDRPAPENLNTGMLELQLFFAGHGHGGHGQGHGGRLQETMVLQGAPDFNSPAPSLPATPAQTVNGRDIPRAAGSVSAATPQFAAHIGKQWTLVGTKLDIA